MPFTRLQASKSLFQLSIALMSVLLAVPAARAAPRGKAAAFQGVQTTVAVGLGIPHGTAVDAAGNIYVSDLIDSRVLKIQRSSTGLNCTVTGSCVPVGSGFVRPIAVAVDRHGSVYIADATTQSVYKVTAKGIQTTLAAGLTGASGIAVAADGTVYVAAFATIVRITAGGTVGTFAAGPAQPGGIALSSGGNVYVADVIGDCVVRINSAGGRIVVATGLNSPQALALDDGGNLFIADTDNSRIVSVPAAAVAYVCPLDCTATSAQVKSPGGVSLDPEGNLYIADTGNQQLVKIAPDTNSRAPAVKTSSDSLTTASMPDY